MGICGVCYMNCRGKCAKCGVALCVKHRPKTARAKCQLCPPSTRTRGGSGQVQGNAYYVPSNAQAQAAYNAATPTPTAGHFSQSRSSGRPPVRPPAPILPDYDGMSEKEIAQHVASLMHRLELKQERELAYLQRRYERGTYTPTDQAYGQDQVLEDELLGLLAHIASIAGKA